MTAIWAAIVAVAGTILGVVVTQVFQARATRRNEVFQQRQGLWREQLAAFRSLAENLHRLRRAEHDRWEQEHAAPNTPAAAQAREAEIRIRPQAWASLAHVELLVDDEELIAHCQGTYRMVRGIHTAGDGGERQRKDEEAREAIDLFLRLSAEYLRRDLG